MAGKKVAMAVVAVLLLSGFASAIYANASEENDESVDAKLIENKVDSNSGNFSIIWTRIYDGGNEDFANGIAVDSNDNVIVN